ncbi:Calcitonin gene-related peptide type 1 like protein [Argiope bruennichi]|uniref:Calcitonin gene-related peptide type 1 like protein n=1 Tax=Argiope bruennichi TaxID=94029 RepID=A0A8T0F837_ARGBR|nr:Calcitonin gene-related peptide type 1 like protein [Argiope bruennichi]
MKNSASWMLNVVTAIAVSISAILGENLTEVLPKCRTERGFGLNFEDYKLDTCARCYVYLPSFAFVSPERKLRYNPNTGLLYDMSTNTSCVADPDNTSHPVYDTFQSDLFARKWIACCRAAIECCRKMQTDPQPPEGTKYCPRTWDGWQCWSDTKAGETASSPCQEHVYFRSEPSTCPNSSVDVFYKEERIVTSAFFTCKVRPPPSFLLPLVLFSTYKQLQVHRITMHKNLFIALLINAALVISFKTIVILDELDNSGNRRTILEENWIGCRLLYILTKYSRMCTYMWMFCEGFYLHKLIAAAFAEQKSLYMFYFIGWIFPIFPVGTVALLRWYFADEQCWAVPVKPYEWVANSLNLLSLFLNLVFLINIIRVLWTKLRATHANEPSQFRKAVRATLVLVPLFGLHFILVMYRPQNGDCFVLEGYSYFSYAMDGLQGLLVSLIFCYLNGEIQGLIMRSFHTLRLQRRLTASSDWRRSTRSETLTNKKINW